jgi:hypothetical protein
MSSEVSVGRGLAMHVKITATQRESVRDNIKRRIELEEEEGGQFVFFPSCREATEMGSARGASRRVCHVMIAFATGKEMGKRGGHLLKAGGRIERLW